MDERRQLPRWQVKRQAIVWLEETKELRDCMIEDINLKGMCMSFNKRLPQEHSLKLSLVFEENFNFVKVEAHLPWVKESQGRFVYGLSFSKIMDTDKEKIDQYIVNHCSEQFKDKWWGK